MSNVHVLDPTLLPEPRRRLLALPEFEPPASLDARVLEALQRPRPSRERWLGLALAATIAAAAVLAWRVQPGDVPDADLAWVARTRALESELAALRRDAPASPAVMQVEAQLARQDAALQAAYDRGATKAELETMWRERSQTLDILIAIYQRPDAIVRL
jgi:hypothetical protein